MIHKLKDFVKRQNVVKSLFRKKFLSFYSIFPPKVLIEATNSCNANCVFCPLREWMNRPKGTMELDTYKKIIIECSKYRNYVGKIGFSLAGEPLLDKTLPEKIKIAKEGGLYTILSTNGSLLIKEKDEEIIKVGLDEILVCLDGYTKETYEKIRRKLSFDVVKKNILDLIQTKDELGAKNPEIRVLFIRTKENEKELKFFMEEWSCYPVKVQINDSHSWEGTIKDESAYIKREEGIKPRPCIQPWLLMPILYDGTITICCIDYNGKYALGNVKKSSIKEIWQGKDYRELRKEHMSLRFKCFKVCESCSYPFDHKSMPWWWFD